MGKKCRGANWLTFIGYRSSVTNSATLSPSYGWQWNKNETLGKSKAKPKSSHCCQQWARISSFVSSIGQFSILTCIINCWKNMNCLVVPHQACYLLVKQSTKGRYILLKLCRHKENKQLPHTKVTQRSNPGPFNCEATVITTATLIWYDLNSQKNSNIQWWHYWPPDLKTEVHKLPFCQLQSIH